MAANQAPLDNEILEAMHHSAEVLEEPTAVMVDVIEGEDNGHTGSCLKSKLIRSLLAQAENVAAERPAEDNDSTTAVCGDDDVASLMDELKDQVDAAVEDKEAEKDVQPEDAAVAAVQEAGFEPEDAVVDANESENAPQVIVEYLLAVGPSPVDMPAINKILHETFDSPKCTSTPKKAGARGSAPEAPQPKDDGASRDSWTDDEAFMRKLTEGNELVVFLKPVEGHVLADWKPSKGSFFAVLGSAVHVGRCRDACYTLETTSIIVERRDISGVEVECLLAVVRETAARMSRFDVAHPVPANGFRAHLICKLIDGAVEELIVGTVHNANSATFVDEVVQKFFRAARSQNVDWSRCFSESAIHLFVDVSRSTNGHHLQHPMVRPATRHRIDYASSARRDLLRHGKALQQQWHFDVFEQYGVTTEDGRKF